MGVSPTQMTVLIQAASAGDKGAAGKLFEEVYGQLRAMAGAATGGRAATHTLHATALVHEAFVKLVSSEKATYNNRGHFMAVAATAMRQILSDHARAKRAAKRGGGDGVSDIGAVTVAEASRAETYDLLALDDLLEELAKYDARMYRIVELRFFAGMEVERVAEFLGVSRSTVEADWRAARAWLGARLRAGA